MPILNPPGFIFNITISKKDLNDDPIDVVTANGTDKYVFSVFTVKWDGSSYGSDTQADIYFSDGRDAQLMQTIPHDTGLELELTSTEARIIELTLIDKTLGGYFKTENVVFSEAA